MGCTLLLWLLLPSGAAKGGAAPESEGSPRHGAVADPASVHDSASTQISPSLGPAPQRPLAARSPHFPRFAWDVRPGEFSPFVSPTEALPHDPQPEVPQPGAPSFADRSGAVAWGPALAQAGDEKPETAGGGTSVPAAEERTYPGYRRDADRAHLDRYKEMTDRAIERGLRYLSERQADAGHFSAKYSVAVTALGGMAMLGNGITYGRGAYGYDVRQAVEYLTSPAIQKHNGYITEGNSTDNPSKMHGHTYAILFLSQVVGTLPDPQEDAAVREVVAKGVKLIVDSQTARGGWGYEPGDEFDEASLTVCALQALRAAKDAGFAVPIGTIRGAVRYLKESCKEDGSFRYSLTRGSRESTYELTAAAVSTLDAAGEYGMAEHARGVEFMRKTLFASLGRKGGAIDAASGYPYYGNLYAGQVYFQLGGELWETWSQEAWPELLRRQKANGSWESRFGPEYATAVALLVLEIPRGYLPIFER